MLKHFSVVSLGPCNLDMLSAENLAKDLPLRDIIPRTRNC